MHDKTTNSTPSKEPESQGRPDFRGKLLGLLMWAGRDPGLTPPSKAVFLSILAHADEHGVCTASDQILATASHTSVPSVQRALLLLQGQKIIQRTTYAPRNRTVRLLPREQPFVVVDALRDGEKQHQQQDGPGDYSPVSSTSPGEGANPVCHDDPETERLVALLTDRKVTSKVARELVKEFPSRIAAQVEAHKFRKVWNVAGSLVKAIREDWPSVTSQSPPSVKVQQEEARKGRDVERQAAFELQAAKKAGERAEQEMIDAYWDGLSEDQKAAFDEEAIEASSYRDHIRSLSTDSPLFRGQKAAARWEHLRRKLGLDSRG